MCSICDTVIFFQCSFSSVRRLFRASCFSLITVTAKGEKRVKCLDFSEPLQQCFTKWGGNKGLRWVQAFDTCRGWRFGLRLCAVDDQHWKHAGNSDRTRILRKNIQTTRLSQRAPTKEPRDSGLTPLWPFVWMNVTEIKHKRVRSGPSTLMGLTWRDKQRLLDF